MDLVKKGEDQIRCGISHLYIFLNYYLTFQIQWVLEQRGFKQCEFTIARFYFWSKNIQIVRIPRNSTITKGKKVFKQCKFLAIARFSKQKYVFFRKIPQIVRIPRNSAITKAKKVFKQCEFLTIVRFSKQKYIFFKKIPQIVRFYCEIPHNSAIFELIWITY